MNNFLQNRERINLYTNMLQARGLTSHGLSCKDFDIGEIVAHSAADIKKCTAFLDLGADGSFILQNVAKLNQFARKAGIDLLLEDKMENGIEYLKGDLMHTPFADESFDFITCLSVIEHQVDFVAFAKEVSRLLMPGGKLIVSFDYWHPRKGLGARKLYGLNWEILDRQEAENLIKDCKAEGLELTSDVDWTLKDQVINGSYCAPFPDAAYTFGIFEFVKQ